MSINSPFISAPDEYKRDINPLRDYIHDQASHLALMENIPYDEAAQYVKSILRPGSVHALHEPNAIVLERDMEMGDREEVIMPMSQFIGDIMVNESIYAPTFTVYHNQKVRMSPLSVFQDANVKSRGKAKKLQFKAEQEEGKESFNHNFYKGQQTTEKLANNAVSGAMISEHNPLCNKTGHSSLTSACRQTSAYGNANNERLLASNRHYWSYQITRNNIVSIVANTDYDLINQVMTRHNLHYPTAEETMGVVERSAKLYWKDQRSYAKIRDLIDHLTPLQRAAFVYTGDMYQLKEFNDAFVRGYIGRIIQRVDVVDPSPKSTIDKWPEDFLNLAKQICSEFTAGLSMDQIKADPMIYGYVASTTNNIGNTLWAYEDLVRAFWATDNVPASIAMFPSSLRRVVLVSDTDSTIFTTQDWILWYCGGIVFDETYDAVCATMIFLASQSIIHILAKMSANVGIGRDHAFTIAMKNEFKFDVFALTNLGKHYYATISAQEGNVKKKRVTEIKGVHLKSSSAPKEVVAQAEAMMIKVMNDIMTKGSISVLERLKEVADLERGIVDSIKQGEVRYLKLSTVKDAGAYKQGADASTFKQYGMWNDVFAPRYGAIAAPPYKAINVSLDVDSKTKINEWLDSLPDQNMARLMRQWMVENNRTTLTSLQLPLPIVMGKGIPDEVMAAMNTRKVVQKATAMFYLVLETLGMYFNHTDLEQLAMDYY